MKRLMNVFATAFAAVLALTTSAGVRVNEVMPSNKTFLQNDVGEYGDWIELYNDGDEAVDLSGWRLSDAPDKKWAKRKVIPDGTVIPAHGYLFIWADGVDGVDEKGVFHVDIGFSASGDDVTLANPEGENVSTYSFGAAIADWSFGYDANGEIQMFSTPTPGAANPEKASFVAPDVVFDVPRGYKTAAFDVTLSPSKGIAEDWTIHYTLDGSVPTAASPVYTEPLRIAKTTCLRASVIDERAEFTSVATVTYIFLDEVLAQGRDAEAPANFPSGATITPFDPAFKQWLWYGMDQQAVSENRERIVRGFSAIPTLSLVTDKDALFDDETGIYVNAQATKTGSGRDWERPASLELIDPVRGAEGEFAVNGGIRLRGHYSRGNFFPKHSFRFFMRSEYGQSRLVFPLFGDESKRTKFQHFDIRADQNHAWPNEIGNQFDQPSTATYVNDVFNRDLQGAAGEPYTRSRYYHLFLNGQYWGLYQTQERVADDYVTDYLGGQDSDWDIISSDSEDIEATEGSLDAYQAFRDITMNEGYGDDHPDNYNKVRGLNPDGTRNPEYPVYLDPKNLARYVILAQWTADVDSPVNPIIIQVNNLRMAYNRTAEGDGFKFFRHDNEHSLGQTFRNFNFNDAEVNAQVLNTWCDGPYTNPLNWGTPDNDTGVDFKTVDRSAVANFSKELKLFNPFLLHRKLMANAEYRMLFADCVQKLCFAGGPLTPAAATALYEKRMAEIDDAIACESARWGCYEKPSAWGGVNRFTRDTWLAACNKVKTDYLPNRTDCLVGLYKAAGWFPSVVAPSVSAPEKELLEPGETLTVSCGTKFYYTTDGSDPRVEGGAVSETAVASETDVVLTPDAASYTVMARAYDESSATWSPLTKLKVKVDLQEEPVGPEEPVDPEEPSVLVLTDAGVTVTKCTLRSSEGISSFEDAERIREADTPEAPTVQYSEAAFGGSVVRKAVAGYIANEQGDYNADSTIGTGSNVGYAAGRWEQSGNAIHKFSGDIAVPSVGTWSIAVGAALNSMVRVTIEGEGLSFSDSYNYVFDAEHPREIKMHILHVDFPAAGTYRLNIGQFRAVSNAYLELSAAPGEVDEFSKDAFTLISVRTHRVTFDANGGSEVAPATVLDGTPVAEPEPPVHEGWAFVRWTLDGAAYDFASPVTDDLTLTAEWTSNILPEIVSLAADPAEVTLSGTSVATTLRVVATDADGDELAYAWSAVGEQPGLFVLASPASAETKVELSASGEYAFQVVVSDGHDAVTSEKVTVTVKADEKATRVTFAGFECSQGPIGQQGTVQDPPLADYPWQTTNTGYKVAWRSTAAGNAENGGRKNLLLDAKRPNAYGLDGYLFFNKNGDVVSTPRYLASFDLASNVSKGSEVIFWIDDPRDPIGEDVKDFKPGVMEVSSSDDNKVVPVGTFRFSSKAARHPLVRVGILAGYGDKFKPRKVYLGSAVADWNRRDESDYGRVDWMFFDIENAKPGDELTLYVDTTGNPWNSTHIEGIVFDSIEKKGFGLFVR